MIIDVHLLLCLVLLVVNSPDKSVIFYNFEC